MNEFKKNCVSYIQENDPIFTIIELNKLAKTNSKTQALTNVNFGSEMQECHKLRCVLKKLKVLFQVNARFRSFANKEVQVFCLSLKQLPLKKIKIHFCYCDLEDHILKLFSQNLRHLSFLTSLTLDFSFGRLRTKNVLPTSKGISMLFSGLKSLKFLSRLKIYFFNAEGFDNYCLEKLSSALANFCSLQVLTLNFLNCSSISDKSLSCFSKALKKLTNLKKLELGINCCNASNAGIQSLSTGLAQMRSLSELVLRLEVSESVNEEGRLESLASTLKNLNFLSILDLDFSLWPLIYDKEVKTLSSCFEFLTSLKILKLSFPSSELMTDDSIKYLALGLASLTSMKSFDLSFSNCSKLQKIESLAHSFERLVSLSELKVHFKDCCNIENKGIESVFSSFKNLNYLVDLELNFAGCKFINDSALKLLVANFVYFPSLEKIKLNFSLNPEISDAVFENMVLNPSLLCLELNFTSCSKISDNGIKNLSLCLQKLKSLTSIKLFFSRNTQIGEEGIESLILNITDLKFLNEILFYFAQCQHISEEKLISICSKLKEVFILYNKHKSFRK